MIRQVLRLAVEAVVVEVRRALTPYPEAPQEPAKSAPKPKGETWDPKAFERQILNGARCPFCTRSKAQGVMMCTPCDDFRKPLRATAAKRATS